MAVLNASGTSAVASSALIMAGLPSGSIFVCELSWVSVLATSDPDSLVFLVLAMFDGMFIESQCRQLMSSRSRSDIISSLLGVSCYLLLWMLTSNNHRKTSRPQFGGTATTRFPMTSNGSNESSSDYIGTIPSPASGETRLCSNIRSPAILWRISMMVWLPPITPVKTPFARSGHTWCNGCI